MSHDPAAPGRQRPEEILASTLSAKPHPESTDGWSERGRRIFLITMAAAGVVLVVAGLLVTKELVPRSGTPAPVQTGPGSGVAGQLLPSNSAPSDVPQTPSASTPLAVPAQTAPSARTAGTATPSPGAPQLPAAGPATATPTPAAEQAPSTTSTIPCGGVLTKGLQQAQIDLPCRAGIGRL